MFDGINELVILILLLGCIAFVLLAIRYQMNKGFMEQIHKRHEQFEMAYLTEEIKEKMFHMTNKHFTGFSESSEQYKRELNKRVKLKKALKGCSSGSMEDKSYIIHLISDLLKEYYINEDETDYVMYFGRPGFLTVKDKFDILLYGYEKNYGGQGLSKLIEEEGWDQLKSSEVEELPVYRVNKEDVEEAYYKNAPILSYEDKILIIAQRIYENYKGYGVVDKIRDMDIDGISGGVSGISDVEMMDRTDAVKNFKQYPKNYESVWIFYKGKSIHFDFLSFGSERELKRVCQGIYRYNKAGQLSEDVGYKVNEMKDGSRVVVVRPPFSESWAFFVRKFHIKKIELDELIQDEQSEIAISLLSFLMKGARITAVTGAQGSGKTTLLMAMIRHIYPTLTLRVQEMAFELNLRKLYPKRNILTFKETETVTGQEGLDLQKKTDGTVNILGEIATDEISVLMLQMAQVASLFTLFTHHGKTVSDLVLSLRNSLLKCNVFRDERIAEEQVVSVLDFDIHLKKDYDGKRYIERITEIVPASTDAEFSRAYKHSDEDKMEAFMDTLVQYFEKRTKQKAYKERVILRHSDMGYIPGEPITQETVDSMLEFMTESDRRAFISFLETVWGSEYAYLYQFS